MLDSKRCYLTLIEIVNADQLPVKVIITIQSVHICTSEIKKMNALDTTYVLSLINLGFCRYTNLLPFFLRKSTSLYLFKIYTCVRCILLN